MAGDWAWGVTGGGTICARRSGPRKARHCSLVSVGGVDTAKSDDGAGKKRIENLHRKRKKKKRKRKRTIDSQFQSDFTPGLGGITLESLMQARHFCLSFSRCCSNAICPVFRWCPEIHLSSGGNPPLNDAMVALVSRPLEWSVFFLSGLINLDPMILQQQTDTTYFQNNKRS